MHDLDDFCSDQRILVEDSNTCGGEFVVYSLLEQFLRKNYKVVFVAAANSFPHYSTVLKKLVSVISTTFVRSCFQLHTLFQGINL